MASNPLAQLSTLGQSPWYDQMTRSLVSQGTLKKMIEEDGLRGLTSNPTIFEKAISGSKDYEDALRQLVGDGAGRRRFTMPWWWEILPARPTSFFRCISAPTARTAS